MKNKTVELIYNLQRLDNCTSFSFALNFFPVSYFSDDFEIRINVINKAVYWDINAGRNYSISGKMQ